MAGYRWTADELAAVAEPDCTFAAFEARFPGERTWTAFRFKRESLGLPARRGDPADMDAATAEPEYRAETHLPPAPEITGVTAGERPDIAAIRAEAERRHQLLLRRQQRKRHQRVRFPHGPVALFFVGDQHIGAPGTDIARMFAEQDAILATPGAYVVLTGDIVDNMIVGKLVAENMHASTTIAEQWELAQHYIARWGDRVIAIVSGNHAQWTTRLAGLDYDRTICPDGVLYDADDLLFDVHVGHALVKVRCRHKWRGHSQWNISHALERAAKLDSAVPDAFVGAHIHRGAVAREFIHDGRRKLALLSSTYKQVDSYAIASGFERNDTSTAVAMVIEDDGAFWGTSSIAGVQAYMRRVYAA